MIMHIYASNLFKNKENPYYIEKDYFLFDENDKEFKKILKEFKKMLSYMQYDLSNFGYEGIRIVITIKEETNPESVKFRLTENGELGVFQNWIRDKDKPFSSIVWKLWSFLNEQLLTKQGKNLRKGA